MLLPIGDGKKSPTRILRKSASDQRSRPKLENGVIKAASHNIKGEDKIPKASRDSFLGRIDWAAVSLVHNKNDNDGKGIFCRKNKSLHNSTDIFSQNPSGSRPKSTSAPVHLKAGGDSDEDEKEYMYKQYRMTKITDQLYLGDDHDANDETALKEEKITHVLSMVARKWVRKPRNLFLSRSWTRNKGIKRKCVPMSDIGNTDVVKLLEEKEVLAFMEESQKRKNKLLVHCQLGQNRSPTIVMAFLMKHEHITFYKAWRKVKQKRLIVQPNVKYIKQLQNWDVYLHGKHSTPTDFLHLKVSGEDISVTHEHANTERMSALMTSNKQKMKKEVSNFSNFASVSSIDTTDLLCIDSPSPTHRTEEELFSSSKTVDGQDKEGNLGAFNSPGRVSNNLLIVSPCVLSTSEEDISLGKPRSSELRFTGGRENADMLVIVSKPTTKLTIDL